MATKKNTQRVVFRTFKHWDWKGDVIALFPDQIEKDYMVGSYDHLAQHSTADYNHVIRQTRPSTVEEYTPLLNELVNVVGYDNLRIVKRAKIDYFKA